MSQNNSRHDPDGRRFDGGTRAPAASFAKDPPQALAHGFPLRRRNAYAKIAFANDPYRIFAIGVEDQDGLQPFSERHDLRPTGNDQFPFELIPPRQPRHLREALDFAENWVRTALDGGPVVQRNS
ncbi:hypothetical protein [Pseudomonas putida]|uniref:hypothetical protein n=1 Tax=Pseudomonas putida TaxID=303 RepID=UPI000CD41E08|nr:hypothetical protein [Pseudomonas putida]POG16955.1 hypothetical protein BGP85_27770 [Pseudomonas putida]